MGGHGAASSTSCCAYFSRLNLRAELALSTAQVSSLQGDVYLKAGLANQSQDVPAQVGFAGISSIIYMHFVGYSSCKIRC